MNRLGFTPRALRQLAKPLVLVFAACSLSACISPIAGSDGLYTSPIGNAPVTSNETPYSPALRCLALHTGRGAHGAPRMAVGQIADYTGKEEFEGGRRVTQGAALMAMSAIAKAGVPMVERFDTSVAELELKYANNRLITDGAGQGPEGRGEFRKIVAGSIPGSDFYLVGGITELNYNIRSTGVDGFASDPSTEGIKANIGIKLFVMNVGLDLRLINTQTLEVVDVISYQKQIIGRELTAGVFDFLNGIIIDVGAGERALEPLQLAVRSVVERAVLEMISSLYRVGPAACSAALGPSGDPLADSNDRAPAPDYTSTQTAYVPEENDNGNSRAEPYRWYSDDGSYDGDGIRGSVE